MSSRSLYAHIPRMLQSWSAAAQSSGMMRFHAIPADLAPLQAQSSAAAPSSESVALRSARGHVSVTVAPGILPKLLALSSGLPARSFRDGLFTQTIRSLPRGPATAFSGSAFAHASREPNTIALTDEFAPAEAWHRTFMSSSGEVLAELKTVQSLDRFRPLSAEEHFLVGSAGWIANDENELVESTPLLRFPFHLHLNVHLHTESRVDHRVPENRPLDASHRATSFAMHATGFSLTAGISSRAPHRWRFSLPRAVCPIVRGVSFVADAPVSAASSTAPAGLRFHVELSGPPWLHSATDDNRWIWYEGGMQLIDEDSSGK